jgi:hypothetical protein
MRRNDKMKCKIGKYHRWFDSDKTFNESGICVKCGWDKFDKRYRTMEK